MRTLRTISVLIWLATVAVACAAPEEPGTGTSPHPTVTVSGVNGDVTTPAVDTNVWALDDTTAVNLLAIGVTPENAAENTFNGDAIVQAGYSVLRKAGVELVEPSNIELVAGASPSLIIGVNFPPHHDVLDRLEKIAPVLLVDDTQPWDTQIALLGTVTGHGAEAEALTARLDNRIKDLAARIDVSPHSGATVSVLSHCGSQVCVYGSGRTAGSVLRELGFVRPPDQDEVGNEWGYTLMSYEHLSAQTADVFVGLTGSISPNSIVDNPLLRTDGTTVATADFGAWYGSGPFSVVWILHDLRAILFDEGRPATADDGLALWEELHQTA